MSFRDKLEGLLRKYDELRDTMSNPAALDSRDFARISKEYSDLTPIVESIMTLKQAEIELRDLKEIAGDPTSDTDMRSMANDEIRNLEDLLPKLTRTVQLSLIPKDAADEKNAILEVRGYWR